MCQWIPFYVVQPGVADHLVRVRCGGGCCVTLEGAERRTLFSSLRSAGDISRSLRSCVSQLLRKLTAVFKAQPLPFQ